MAEKLIPTDYFTRVEPDFEPEEPIGGGILDHGEVDGTHLSDRTIGYSFSVSAALEVTKLRLYTDHALTETIKLWDVATQALLASADISGGGVLAWYEAQVDPVTLETGKSYVVSAWAGGSIRAFLSSTKTDLAGLTFHPDVTPIGLRHNSGDAYPGGGLFASGYIPAGDFGIEAVATGPTERTFDNLVPIDMFSE